MLTAGRIARAFPASASRASVTIAAALPQLGSPPAGSIVQTNSGRWPDLTVTGERVDIPYRIHNPEPAAEVADGLPAIECDVLACLYTRHHDGYVRQRYLPQVLASPHPWAVPFVVQLCGEYVVQIARDVERWARSALADHQGQRENVVAFVAANPEYIDLTKRRAVSYWNVYYRQACPRADYPGLRALSRLENAGDPTP